MRIKSVRRHLLIIGAMLALVLSGATATAVQLASAQVSIDCAAFPAESTAPVAEPGSTAPGAPVDPAPFPEEGDITVFAAASLAVRERTRLVLEEIRRTPGVVAAGAVSSFPVGRMIDTRDAFWAARGVPGSRFSVGEGFFRTMGTRVLAGREIDVADLDASAAVALVNRAGVAALWPGASPQEVVGRTLELPEGVHARMARALRS